MLATRSVPAGAVLAEATRQKMQAMTLSATRDVTAGAVLDAPLFARALHGETVDAEYRVVTIDGQAWCLQWSEAPLRDAGGVIQGAVVWVQDLTLCQRSMAGIVPRPAAVPDMHAECWEAVAGISHDLKNPLTRIKGLAQLLQRRLVNGHPLDPVEFHDRLEQIDRTVGKMTLGLNELAQTTHLQAGSAPSLDRQPTDLVRLARHLVDEYQHATEDHQICLHTADSEAIGVWDAQKIERAVSNLLSNAVKYSPEGGDIAVRIERTEPEGWAMLQVSDQGIGIPYADLPRIFESSHRAANVVGRMNGTGMGLAGVRQIVEQHGGTVAVESWEGRGTTVMVWLPLQPDADDTHRWRRRLRCRPHISCDNRFWRPHLEPRPTMSWPS
jgi:signal transduction histidine kinase